MKPPRPGDALLVVDVQNDFLPGGALGIAGGDAVLAPLNRLLGAWRARGLPVYLTRDWHPPGHCSFVERGGPWPAHCVAGTADAALPGRPMLVPAMRGGRRLAQPTLAGIRAHAQAEIPTLPAACRRLRDPDPLVPTISAGLRDAAARVDREFP